MQREPDILVTFREEQEMDEMLCRQAGKPPGGQSAASVDGVQQHIAALRDLRLGVDMDRHHLDDGLQKLDALDAAIAALRGQAAAPPSDEIEGLRAHVALLKASLAQAERELDALRVTPTGAAMPVDAQAIPHEKCLWWRNSGDACPGTVDTQAIRDAALEEAAKIADDKAARVNSTWIANDIAEGIRALKGNSHGE
ncbi:hypothetical protein GCM10023144_01660 [Pigmentiphaga soli]|uniref:Uncharacterized protein n=1 Tax=Pigmentiphaga soli TaxID=1007095 RepID=A0ABP8GCW2_9BURK